MPRLAFDAQITFVPTTDLTTCAHFYETIMVLPMVLDQGTCRIYQVTEQSYLGFCQSDDPLPWDDRVILTLVSDDVDGWYARLNTQGVTTDGPPREHQQHRIYHFFARDANGYRLEFQRFLDPFPPESPSFPPDEETPPGRAA